MAIISFIAGVLFFIYFISIAFFVGYSSKFFFIWLILSLVCFVICYLIRKGKLSLHLSKWLHKMLIILISACVLVFVFVEGCIISEFDAKGSEDLDYIIVLGAQIRKSGPSRVLKMRLDAAYDYLTENEGTIAIVSGGKGADEHISEAQGMYEYLIEKGIPKERILQEDQSKNTFQNLSYSSQYLNKEIDQVGIVTNNFHVFRATRIAMKEDYQHVEGIAAKSEFFMQPNNMLREFAGIIKDFMLGNL